MDLSVPELQGRLTNVKMTLSHHQVGVVERRTVVTVEGQPVTGRVLPEVGSLIWVWINSDMSWFRVWQVAYTGGGWDADKQVWKNTEGANVVIGLRPDGEL